MPTTTTTTTTTTATTTTITTSVASRVLFCVILFCPCPWCFVGRCLRSSGRKSIQQRDLPRTIGPAGVVALLPADLLFSVHPPVLGLRQASLSLLPERRQVDCRSGGACPCCKENKENKRAEGCSYDICKWALAYPARREGGRLARCCCARRPGVKRRSACPPGGKREETRRGDSQPRSSEAGICMICILVPWVI